jgi:GAF domain-containing protein
MNDIHEVIPSPQPRRRHARGGQALSDSGRLEALYRAAILDTPAEEIFDRLTLLASHVLRVPVTLLSLVDQDRQFFKSQVGVGEPWASQRGTPLSYSFCQYVVTSGQPLIVTDARSEPLLRENPAIHDLDVVAYAGMPITSRDGYQLGTLCVIDSKPRVWTEMSSPCWRSSRSS